MSERKAPVSVAAFEAFFWSAYRPLVRDVIFAGGSPYEAEDAVAAAMEEVLKRWDTIENLQAYARRAAISNLIKAKKRGPQRIVNRLIQRGDVPPEHALDSRLTVWEQQEWVTVLLKSLPPAQRDVLACIVDEFTLQEIAELLGKTEAAVRQNLCAARKSLMSYSAGTSSARGGRHGNREEAR